MANWQLLLHPACERELLDLKSANDDLLTKVIHDLRLLREFGLDLLTEGRIKKLSEDIFELRTGAGLISTGCCLACESTGYAYSRAAS